MKNLLILFFFLGAISVFAQNTNYYNRMEHVFGAIEQSKVTTGLLKEFGVRLNEVEAYNGSGLDTTNWVDVTQWQSLYYSLYSMRVGTATTMIDPATVYAQIDNEVSANPGIILFAAEYFNYQQYKADAYTNGDVTVTNDRIYDVTGRNPYEIKTTFAVAPLEHYLKGNSFSFKIQDNMIYSNTGYTLASVSVDFGDGLGYQTLSLNTVNNVNYSSPGEKELKVKFVYSGGYYNLFF